jgi:hypothetical protein
MAHIGERAGASAGLGRLVRVGQKGGARHSKKRKAFFFIFSINSPKSPILSIKNSFSKVDPKTKVVQNLVLYNIALGHILKFQIDFELEIQSSF